jgi:multisubunit Na+/H+ antiporter MnhC subunit
MIALAALALTAFVMGFAIGAMSLNIKPRRLRPKDFDIDTILANAEKPFYEKTT